MKSIPVTQIPNAVQVVKTAEFKALLAGVVGDAPANALQGQIGKAGWTARAYSDSVSLHLDWITPDQAVEILRILKRVA